MTNQTTNRTEFVVSWPIQGIACFRSQESELVLSDVYWQWIFEALADETDDGQRLPCIEAANDGFRDASNLVEAVPVTARFLVLLRRVAPSAAPSFELVIPAEGCVVPTPDQILAEFTKLVGEALSSGIMEMEIE